MVRFSIGLTCKIVDVLIDIIRYTSDIVFGGFEAVSGETANATSLVCTCLDDESSKCSQFVWRDSKIWRRDVRPSCFD